jgi:hypothetical protein
MKLTESHLRNLIKQELDQIISEDTQTSLYESTMDIVDLTNKPEVHATRSHSRASLATIEDIFQMIITARSKIGKATKNPDLQNVRGLDAAARHLNQAIKELGPEIGVTLFK